MGANGVVEKGGHSSGLSPNQRESNIARVKDRHSCIGCISAEAIRCLLFIKQSSRVAGADSEHGRRFRFKTWVTLGGASASEAPCQSGSIISKPKAQVPNDVWTADLKGGLFRICLCARPAREHLAQTHAFRAIAATAWQRFLVRLGILPVDFFPYPLIMKVPPGGLEPPRSLRTNGF